MDNNVLTMVIFVSLMTELYTRSGDLFVPSDSHLGLKAREKISNYSMENKMSIIKLKSVSCNNKKSVSPLSLFCTSAYISL